MICLALLWEMDAWVREPPFEVQSLELATSSWERRSWKEVLHMNLNEWYIYDFICLCGADSGDTLARAERVARIGGCSTFSLRCTGYLLKTTYGASSVAHGRSSYNNFEHRCEFHGMIHANFPHVIHDVQYRSSHMPERGSEIRTIWSITGLDAMWPWNTPKP